MKKVNLGMLAAMLAVCSAVGVMLFQLYSFMAVVNAIASTQLGKSYNGHVDE